MKDTEREIKDLLKDVQDSTYDIINLLLGGKCRKTNVLASAEHILKISEIIEKKINNYFV